jgi:hypothetical protein
MTNAVLLRNVPLVMRDVSSGGCSIESRTPLQVGMVGWLEVEFQGERRFEWFRVARVSTGSEGVFLAGVEFLPLSAAGADSLRSAIGRLRRWAAPDVSREEAGRSSGDPGNSEAADVGAPAVSSSVAANSTRKIIKFFHWR